MTRSRNQLVRELMRRGNLAQQAGAAREAIIAGYQDAIAGRTHAFDGDLQRLLDKSR